MVTMQHDRYILAEIYNLQIEESHTTFKLDQGSLHADSMVIAEE